MFTLLLRRVVLAFVPALGRTTACCEKDEPEFSSEAEFARACCAGAAFHDDAGLAGGSIGSSEDAHCSARVRRNRWRLPRVGVDDGCQRQSLQRSAGGFFRRGLGADQLRSHPGWRHLRRYPHGGRHRLQRHGLRGACTAQEWVFPGYRRKPSRASSRSSSSASRVSTM